MLLFYLWKSFWNLLQVLDLLWWPWAPSFVLGIWLGATGWRWSCLQLVHLVFLSARPKLLSNLLTPWAISGRCQRWHIANLFSGWCWFHRPWLWLYHWVTCLLLRLLSQPSAPWTFVCRRSTRNRASWCPRRRCSQLSMDQFESWIRLCNSDTSWRIHRFWWSPDMCQPSSSSRWSGLQHQ